MGSMKILMETMYLGHYESLPIHSAICSFLAEELSEEVFFEDPSLRNPSLPALVGAVPTGYWVSHEEDSKVYQSQQVEQNYG